MPAKRVPKALTAAAVLEIATVLCKEFSKEYLWNALRDRLGQANLRRIGVNESCKDWLVEQADAGGADFPSALLSIVQEFERQRPKRTSSRYAGWSERRRRVRLALAKDGFDLKDPKAFGLLLTAGPTVDVLERRLRSLKQLPIEREFKRTLSSLKDNPADAITAASTILEAIFKVYISRKGLPRPASETPNELWRTIYPTFISSGLGTEGRDDLKQIVSGLSSIIHGVAALRSHQGSSHGRWPGTHPPEARLARLAVASAHVVALFLVETWRKELTNRASRKRHLSA
jgi:hypothetical protein